MNAIVIILLSAFIGTTLMTIFSYFLSYIFKNQFKEPVLLQKLLENSDWVGEGSLNIIAGWLLHYGAGIGFVIIYYLLWNFAGVQPSFFTGGLLGLASGFLGVGVWWMIFKIHRNPPAINLSAYFLHLVVVHIVFGIGATAGYHFTNGL